LIGRLNQTAADGVFPLSAFKPSSSYSADRGRSIIRVTRKPALYLYLRGRWWYIHLYFFNIKLRAMQLDIYKIIGLDNEIKSLTFTEDVYIN